MPTNVFSQELNDTETTLAVYVIPVQHWEQVITAVLIVLIAVAGLIGNSMIILAVSFSRKLQTTTNVFVTNLAVVDLLTSFILIWYTVGALGGGEWPIPRTDWMCEVTGFSILAFIGTSTHNLAFIALNRLIRITKPRWYRKIFTPRKLTVLLAMIWIVPAGSFIVVLATGRGAFGYNKRNHICGPLGKGSDVLLIVEVCIGLFIPGLAILLSYVWIYIYVKRHFKAQKKNASSIAFNLSNKGTQNDTSEITADDSYNPSQLSNSSILSKYRLGDRKNDKFSKQQIKITKNLFLTACAFFACFMPYFILLILSVNPTVAHIEYYAKLVPISNSSINFVIYACRHPDFKIVLWHMMQRSYTKIPEPSRFLKFLLSKKK